MDILLDVNVVLNYITNREDANAGASRRIMELCASDRLRGYLAFHSISIIWYVLRKRPDNERRAWLKDICEILTVTGASHEAVVDAIRRDSFKDFEDCLQDKCAQEAGAEYIITANVSDYEQSEIPAITPIAFIDRMDVSER